MSVTVVEDETPAVAPTVIVEAPEPDHTPDVADAVADAVEATADAIARVEETAAVESIVSDVRIAELQAENDTLRQSQAFRDGVDVGESRVADEEPDVFVEDEVVAPTTHAWFRPMSEWRRDK